jgi:hypothetical protein
MRFVAGIIAGAVLSAFSAQAFAIQSGAATSPVKSAEVSFQMEWSGLPVPRFTVRVREEGTGSYQAEEMEGAADPGAVHYGSEKHIDRTMSLTPATVAKIFKAARDLNRFKMECDSKKKNLANTGKKTLSYTGEDGVGSCVYNYSDNKEVTMLTETFLAIAYTMDEGRRLEYLHRYDRLGLDAEMNSLQDQVKAGRAIELGTIEPVLTSIASDMAVMERVRLRAAGLLTQAKNIK